ncbi:hypothetical protein IT413_04010 [Candidatus Peregrinibacteria bacterium]|nr:hypothetical protein [Candidatus Peregrinibacteria bacterium]
MTKRLFLQNPGTISCHLGQGVLQQNKYQNSSEKRLIFANTGSGSGSEGGAKNPDDISLSTLADDLQSLEGTTLTVEQVTKALNVLDKGDQKAKEKLLDLTKKLVAGTYTASAFETRLPHVAESENKEATPAASPETKAKAEAEAINTNIEHIASPISQQIKSLLESTQEVANDNAIDSAPNSAELKERFLEITKDLETINELDKKNVDKETNDLKKVFAALPAGQAPSPEDQAKIVNLDPFHPDYQINFAQATAGMVKEIHLKQGQEGVDKVLNEIKKIKQEAHEANKKIEEDFKKRMSQFRELMNQMSSAVQEKYEKEQAIKQASIRAGINLTPGQKICWFGLEERKKLGFRMFKQSAIIEAVDVVAGGTVMITLKFIDPITGATTLQTFSPVSFGQWVDAMGVTEDISTREELEKSIGLNLKKGQHFEHEIIQNSENPLATEVEDTIIQEVDEANRRIILDHSVKLSPQGEPTSILQYSEFAKWFKQNQVVESINTLDELQAELRGFNEVQLAQNPRKKNTQPIKVEVGEILCVNQNTDAKIAIAEVGDKYITLDDGTKRTYAGFLKLVKDMDMIHYEPTKEEKKKIEEAKNAEAEKPANDNHAEDDKHDAHGGHDDHGHGHGHHLEIPRVGYLTQLWASTYILSPHSLYEFGEKIVEFIKRKLDRGEHGRVGVVGERIFGAWNTELGAEFKGIAQHAENEEVNHHVHHMETMGLETVKHEIHEAANRDILKAAITVAANKGALRWDDPGLWNRMNILIAKYGPIFKDGEALFVSPENHMAVIEKYLDHWFGQDTFREFRNKQDSSYNSIKSNFKDVATRLETDPEKNGGLGGALRKLMWKHVATDEYVNPAEYESYLHAAIENGKLTFEQKIMYLIMGFAADGKGAHGHAGLTMFHPDRMGALDTMANTFPFTNFFTAGDFIQYDVHGQVIMDEKTGQPKRGKIGTQNFKDLMNEYILPDLNVKNLSDLSDPTKLVPGNNIRRLINEVMSDSPNVKVRIEKAAGDATRWDHDDMDRHVSVLSESLVEQLLGKQGGTRQQVTTPGLKNAYAGYNDYMRIRLDLIEKNKKSGNKDEVQKQNRRFVDLMKAFIKFDAILDSRAYHKGGNYTRFSQSDYASYPGVTDKFTVEKGAVESRRYIGELAYQLDQETNGRYNLSKTWNLIVSKGVNEDAQEKALKSFGEYFDGALAELGDTNKAAEIFLKVSQKQNITGMGERSQVKTEVEEESGSVNDFKPYINKEVMAKVGEINELTEQLAKQENRSPAQIKAQENQRLKEIIEEVNDKRYASQPDDLRLLNEYIQNLQRQINQKESAERGAGNNQQGGAQNDNGQATPARPRRAA